MKYLLDTDHLSFLQRRSGPEYSALTARLAGHPVADFGNSVISFHEQALGAHTYLSRARTPADLVRGYGLFGDILRGFRAAPVLPFDAKAADVLASLQVQRVRISSRTCGSRQSPCPKISCYSPGIGRTFKRYPTCR